MVYAFWVLCNKSLPKPIPQRFSLVFFFLEFWCLAAMFRFMIYFTIIFVYAEKWQSRFNFCIWLFSYPSTICWKFYPLSIELLSNICQKLTNCIYMYWERERDRDRERGRDRERERSQFLDSFCSSNQCFYLYTSESPPTMFFIIFSY